MGEKFTEKKRISVELVPLQENEQLSALDLYLQQKLHETVQSYATVDWIILRELVGRKISNLDYFCEKYYKERNVLIGINILLGGLLFWKLRH